MGAVGGIGAKLLSKMGWEEGTGLGARRDGRLEPVAVRRRAEKLGVGAERRPFQDAWWERALDEAYGGPAQASGHDLLLACEGRRCRPGGGAKLARLERQEREVGAEKGRGMRERRKRKGKKEKAVGAGAREIRKVRKKRKKVGRTGRANGGGSQAESGNGESC